MIKSDWIALLESSVETLNKKSWECSQEKMITAFHEQESERLWLFAKNEDVGHKEELIEMFDRFQGSYAHENNASFTRMSII